MDVSMHKATWSMMMIGVGVYQHELDGLSFEVDPHVPTTAGTTEQRVWFARRTMPAFSAAVYIADVVPHRRAMH